MESKRYKEREVEKEDAKRMNSMRLHEVKRKRNKEAGEEKDGWEMERKMESKRHKKKKEVEERMVRGQTRLRGVRKNEGRGIW